MAEHRFTLEQIRHQAQENALYYLLASVVYFREQGHPPQQFMAAVGHTLALHVVSLGGSLVATAGNDTLAYATFAHVPSSDVLKSFGLTRHEADAIWDIFKPIARSLKMEYEWSREQDEVTFKLSHSVSLNA